MNMPVTALPASAHRVRLSTAPHINEEIDRTINLNIQHYASRTSREIHARLQELDREWDVERVLEVNASTLALIGLVLGTTKDKRWLALPGVVLPFLLQHGLQGWCPPLPLLRRLGFRTRHEIDRERHALQSILDER